MSWKKILGFLVAACLTGAVATTTFAQAPIPLDQAVRDGKVSVRVHGLGGSTGDALEIAVRSRVPGVLHLSITPGTVFRCSGGAQDMVAAAVKGLRLSGNTYSPTSVIHLDDQEQRTYVVEAYCLDFHKNNPSTNDTFTISTLDRKSERILRAGSQESASIGAIQSALWMDRGVSTSRLKSRLPVTDDDIQRAREILRRAQQEEESIRREARLIRVGDTVVATGSAPIMRGKTPLMTAGTGTEMVVTAVRGDWIGVSVSQYGESVRGWVHVRYIARRRAGSSKGVRSLFRPVRVPLGRSWTEKDSRPRPRGGHGATRSSRPAGFDRH